MNDQRVGSAFRAVRIKRGWRQTDVARRARVSDGIVSLIERGHLERVSVTAFRRVAAVLEIRAEVSVSLPHGELERLLNAGHSAMPEIVAAYFGSLPGWVHAPEVSFSIYGERGVIDVLAFHPSTGSLLVIELKTELVSLEDLLMTMDVRLRHATKIALERGWHAKTVSAWVLFAESATNHRRVAAHRSVLRAAFAQDGRSMRAWLQSPTGAVRALSSWSVRRLATNGQTLAQRRQVRVREAAGKCSQSAA
ncbi:MAG: helix-turn-helix domain-containing protein [Chloroflexota bacterium]|nr:helix-turn-helix domain-containing protein [Chloroflexota bacterium]